MGVIEVIEPGLLTTIQDVGRFGYLRHGVPVSGAMDPVALRLANLLVGRSGRRGLSRGDVVGAEAEVQVGGGYCHDGG